MSVSMGAIILICVCGAFVVGFGVGSNQESRWWLKACADDFVEREHLRSENTYLKKKLGMTEKDTDAGDKSCD